MKNFLIIFALIFSTNAFARTHFSAVLNNEFNVLTIKIEDDRLFPPFEAGELWKAMKGAEYRKFIDEDDFKMDCESYRNSMNDIYGDCVINIPMNLFQKIGETQVFKLKGSSAARLNRYFTDSAYVAIQGGRVYLSSYNTRREFYFGIQDRLITR